MPITLHFAKSTGISERGYIRVRWIHHGLTVRSTIGINIEKRDWDEKHSRVYKGARFGDEVDATVINKLLDIFERMIADEDGKEDKNENLTTVKLKEKLREIISLAYVDALACVRGVSKHLLISEYKKFIELMFVKRNWTNATRVNYRKLLPYLDKQAKNLYVENINMRFMEAFYKEIIGSLTERTAHNLMTCLRSFLRWCIAEYGISDDCLAFTYKSRKNVKDMVYLTTEELNKLISVKFTSAVDGFSSHELDFVRDMFLFCCLTGLRFSDMQRLEWRHVFRNSIRMYTKKTMKLVEIELNPLSLNIISRYDNGAQDGYVFPRIDNGTMNKVLKTIGQQIGLSTNINRLYYRHGKREEDTISKSRAITTHTGRHTFAVQALSSGVPGSVVMAWTGHSDYDSLKPYMDITSDAKRKAMNKFEHYMEDVFV